MARTKVQKQRRRRTNVDKQEQVVTIIWEFARANQDADPKDRMLRSFGTTVGDTAIRKALAAIMDTFGYDVAEIQ